MPTNDCRLSRNRALSCAAFQKLVQISCVEETTKIAIFKGRGVRKTIHNNEWWFSVVDVCGVLAESADSGAYWRKLKQRLKEEGSEVVTFCHGLKLEASDGKKYETDCANTPETPGISLNKNPAKKFLPRKII